MRELTAEEKLKVAEEEIRELIELISWDDGVSAATWDKAESISNLMKFGWRVI